MDANSQLYLPAFLRVRGKVNSASLISSESANGGFTHTYTVSWTGHDQRRATQARPVTSESFLRFFKALDPLHRPRISDSTVSERDREVPAVECDGPCKKVRLFSDMKILGLCEHVVCRECLKKRPSISVSDGGSGCPNYNCYTEDLTIKACKSCGDKTCQNTSGIIRCDGPCNAKIPFNMMKVIGLCEHVVCLQCLNTEPRVSKKDGGSGCPNIECYEDDQAIKKIKDRLTNNVLISTPKQDKTKADKKRGAKSDTKSEDLTRTSDTSECSVRLPHDSNLDLASCDDTKMAILCKNAMNESNLDSKASDVSSDLIQTHDSNSSFISSKTFDEPIHKHKSEQPPGLIKVKLRIFNSENRDYKWLSEQIPNNYELLDAVKQVMKNQNVCPSETGYNFLFLFPNLDSSPHSWWLLQKEDLRKQLKDVVKGKEIYMALNIPL